MSCCTQCLGTETQFGVKRAERDLKQYEQNGADAVTRLMIAALEQRPLQGSELLDIGGGIGVIATELAKSGVRKATLVEASTAYLDVARRKMGNAYPQGLAQFVLGDFTALASTLAGADVVTLGRVVCCYPDAETLLQQAAARTRRVLAFTYPSDRWYVRAVNVLENFWRRLRGSSFRSYIHPPAKMEAVLEKAGLVRVAQQQGTFVWMLDVYERK